MSNTIIKTSLRGFTLIELLVVIAIIGLLSTAIMGPVQTGLKKGRDTRKISDLSQIQGALLQYAGDNNGSYPLYLSGGTSSPYSLASTTPTYMVPDIKMTTDSAARDRFMYVVYADLAGNIVSYHLGVALENQNASLQGDADCGMLSGGAATAILTAVPPITTTWGAIGTAVIPTNDSVVTNSCVSIGDSASQFNSNAWSGSNDQAGQNDNNPGETGATTAADDFGGAGLKELAGDVCSAKLDTCIFDITPN